jgi:hypothetical protein
MYVLRQILLPAAAPRYIVHTVKKRPDNIVRNIVRNIVHHIVRNIVHHIVHHIVRNIVHHIIRNIVHHIVRNIVRNIVGNIVRNIVPAACCCSISTVMVYDAEIYFLQNLYLI